MNNSKQNTNQNLQNFTILKNYNKRKSTLEEHLKTSKILIDIFNQLTRYHKKN